MTACRIAVSTWSLHASLGPIRLTQRLPDGSKGPWVREFPHTLDLLDFPAEAVPGLGVGLDVGNFPPALENQRHESDFAGIDWEPLYAGIRRVAPLATMVHAKSARFEPDGRHAGWDLVHAPRLTREAGFGGDVSIEYGGGVDEWENALRTKHAVEAAFAG